MNCPSCGNNLKPNESFCTHCGRKVDNSNNNDNKKRHSLIVLLPIICLVVIAILVIFFILCVRNLKTNTVELMLPEISKISKEESIADDGVITFIIDGLDTKNQKGDNVSRSKDGVVYYYEGKPDLKNGRLREIGIDSVRVILDNKNHELITKIDNIKQEWEKGNIDENKYKELVSKAKVNDANEHRVIVKIKPTENANYSDVVKLLDIMQLSVISTYQISTLTKMDSVLYEHTMGRPFE